MRIIAIFGLALLQTFVWAGTGDPGHKHKTFSADCNRIQLTSDGLRAYLEAVEGAFGADIDYAVLNKIYGASSESAKGRYSPAECVGCRKDRIEGTLI